MAPNYNTYAKPSLLDRLDSRSVREIAAGPPLRNYGDGAAQPGEEFYKDSVLRDLEWLFNSVAPVSLDDAATRRKYPQVAKSVLGYGLRGVLGRVVKDVAEIKRQVVFALEAFEPRLQVEWIRPIISHEGQLIEIQIKGFLLTQQARRHLWIRTDLETMDSRLRIEGNG